jgi:hypothetical protein
MKKVPNKFHQQAKDCLVGKEGPFSGWVHTGLEFQNFDLGREEHTSDAPEPGSPLDHLGRVLKRFTALVNSGEIPAST